MRKKYGLKLNSYLSLFLLLFVFHSNAQVSSYGFNQSSGTYTPITGGTVLGFATNDDTSYPNIPIGFSFLYNGTTYTEVSINSNGQLALGTSISYSYTPISDGFASNNMISALGSDLQGNATTGELSYLLVGTAPNREFVVQWKSYRKYAATGDDFNFQIRLSETSNIVRFVYGSFVNNATSSTYEVGLKGASTADFNNRTTTTNWSASTAGATNSASNTISTTVLPTSGTTYAWSMPPAAPPTPVQAGGIPTCTAGTQLSITGTTAPDETWYWQTTATGTSTATPYAGPYTVLANGTYFVRTFNSTFNLWSTASSVTVSNFPTASAPPAPTAGANPACNSTTLTAATPGAGVTYYWQTVANGSSTTNDAATPLPITTSGTYYLAAYESASQCWSNTVSTAVTVSTYVPAAPVTNDTINNVCANVTSVLLNAAPGAGSGSVVVNLGNNVTLAGSTSQVINGTLNIPAGATVTSALLSFNGVTTTGSTYPSDIDVNMTGSATLATTVLSSTFAVVTNAGPYTHVPTISGSGAFNLNLTNNWFSNATFTSITLTVNYSLPVPTINWYDAASSGNLIGTGSPFESVGTTVLPNTATGGSYMFYAGATVGGCTSATLPVTVNITPVLAVLSPVNVSCNGLNDGSFTLGAVTCGTQPFEYSVNGGAYSPAIPTNLVAGTYSITIKDASLAVSAPILVVITEPSAPTALTATNVTYFNGSLGWTAMGSETSWTVEYGPAGFTPGTGTIETATTNPWPITGLTENTAYEFYVAAACAPGSDVAGPFAFTTDPGFLTWDNECPASGFVDISTTGTDLNLLEDGEAGITLPFNFPYQGSTLTNISIGNNGGIQLGTLTGNVGYGGNMTTQLGDFLYAWGDDMDAQTGNVYYQVVGTSPNQVAIIQWNALNNYLNGAGTVTFQIQMQENGEIYYVYNDVVFGGTETADDYADNADIGLSGPTTDINVSNDSPTYLQNNSCVHFYYALCPNVTNFTSLIFQDDAILDWNAGLYGETQWTLIYGPAGFDPTVAGQAIDTFDLVSSDASFGGTLTQLTEYDVYIYSECAADNLTSSGYFFNFTTLPYCSNPASIIANTDVDSLEAAWNWTASSIDYPILSYNIQYGPTGFNLYDGTIVAANGTNLADTIFDASFMGGGVYQVYVQAVCTDVVNGGTDTSAFSGPITFIMPLTTDTVCGAELLTVDGTVYTFNNTGATVSFDETNIAPPATGAQTTDGWANSTLNNTTWYKFIAPASGSIRVNATANTYNGQIGVYDVNNCADFNTNFDLVAANDNEIGGTSLAPNFTVCGLTPGNEYYIMHDGFNATTGNHTIAITEIVLEAGASISVTDICSEATLDLFTTINGYDAGGEWSAPVAAVDASISGSIFNSTGLAYQTFTFQYRVTDGCAYDSITSQISVFAPSSAGTDGSLTVCKNEVVDLLSGLGGNVQTGGTWYDPSNNVMPSSQITASAFPGSFNYDYIAGNGVCPNDTANVVVVVSPSCDINSIDESVFAGVSVYPNPSTGIIYVDADLAAGNFDYVVTDANGRVIAKATNGVKAASTSTIDLRGVETGVYFIRLSNQSSDKMFRIVVQ